MGNEIWTQIPVPVFQGFKNVFFFPKNATHQVVIKRYSNSSLWEKTLKISHLYELPTTTDKTQIAINHLNHSGVH